LIAGKKARVCDLYLITMMNVSGASFLRDDLKQSKPASNLFFNDKIK